MKKYPKIPSVFQRNERGEFIQGKFTHPEIEYLEDNRWLGTEKVDGMNIRIIWDGCGIQIKGRTDRAQVPEQLRENIMTDLSHEKLTQVFQDAEGVCLYGEGYGPKIQKGGGNYGNEQKFVLFDVWIDGWWLDFDAILDVGFSLGLTVVPTIWSGTLDGALHFVRNGFKSAWGDFPAEGLVLKPPVQLYNKQGHRIITKIKTKDFEQ